MHPVATKTCAADEFLFRLTTRKLLGLWQYRKPQMLEARPREHTMRGGVGTAGAGKYTLQHPPHAFSSFVLGGRPAWRRRRLERHHGAWEPSAVLIGDTMEKEREPFAVPTGDMAVRPTHDTVEAPRPRPRPPHSGAPASRDQAAGALHHAQEAAAALARPRGSPARLQRPRRHARMGILEPVLHANRLLAAPAREGAQRREFLAAALHGAAWPRRLPGWQRPAVAVGNMTLQSGTFHLAGLQANHFGTDLADHDPPVRGRASFQTVVRLVLEV